MTVLISYTWCVIAEGQSNHPVTLVPGTVIHELSDKRFIPYTVIIYSSTLYDFDTQFKIKHETKKADHFVPHFLLALVRPYQERRT